MSENGSQRRYETRDVSARTMAWSAFGLVILTVAGLAASWLVMKYFVTTQKLGPPASPFDQTRTIPPAPRLSVKPELDLKKLQAEEKARLSEYGWVDRGAGIVRIPIERAMQLSLERGFPVRPTSFSQYSSIRRPQVKPPAPKRHSP